MSGRDPNPVLAVAMSPVLSREMRVSGRKLTTYLLRFLAAGLALFVATVGYIGVTLEATENNVGTAASLQSLQELAPGVTTALIWVSYAGVMLIAPLLSAPAICDEKRARTLSALATSPLSSAEIIFGHFASRFVQLAIILLLPAPMLLGLRSFGGVPAEYILGSMCMLMSLGALGVALGVMGSVGAKRSVTAFFSAVALLGMLAFAPLIWFAISQEWPSRLGPPAPIVWMAAAPWILADLSSDAMGGSFPLIGIDTRTAWVGSVCVHWALTFAALGVATLRFRSVIRVEAAGGEDAAAESDRRASRRRFGRWYRAAVIVGTWTVVLLSPVLIVIGIHDDAGSDAALVAMIVFGIIGLGRAMLAVGDRLRARAELRVWDHPILWRELRQPLITSPRWRLNVWAIALGLLAVIAVGADMSDDGWIFPLSMILFLAHLALSSVVTPLSISTEREGRTWSALMTTPRRPWEVLAAKAAGGLRRVWPAPLAIAVLGVLVLSASDAPLYPVVFSLLVMAGPTVFLIGTGLVAAVLVRKTVPALALNIFVGVFLWLMVPIGFAMLNELFHFDFEWLALTNPPYMFVTMFERGGDEFYFEVIGRQTPGQAAMVYATFSGAYALLGLLAAVLAVTLFKRAARD